MFRLRLVSANLLVLSLLAGCSVRQVAVHWLGDALAGGGGVYASDNDPDLIREALPFGLKTFESLLESAPEHRGLLQATAQGFTAYAYFLQLEAERLDPVDFQRAQSLRSRARKLYLRGRDYALRGLEIHHPDLMARLKSNDSATLTMTNAADIPFLYWAGASWAGAIGLAKDDPALLIDLPVAGALVRRVLDLDEAYDSGTAHEFFISFEGSRPGGSRLKAREHYRKALELSGGRRASIHLALAESVVVREQNLSEFSTLIEKVLSIDPHRTPRTRLVNTVARQRALWLQSRISDLFVEVDTQQQSKVDTSEEK